MLLIKEFAMSVRFRSLYSLLAVALSATLAWAPPALSSDADSKADAVILVAHPQLYDALYGSSIVLAKPMPDGSALGFILNKPTSMTLGELFPEHEASLKFPESVFLGGPVGTGMIVALVARQDSPGAGSIPLAPGLFLAVKGEIVDRVIESDPSHARIFAGVVVWRPGELDDELKRGVWFEIEPDTRLVFSKKTDGLWEELVKRSEFSRNGI